MGVATFAPATALEGGMNIYTYNMFTHFITTFTGVCGNKSKSG